MGKPVLYLAEDEVDAQPPASIRARSNLRLGIHTVHVYGHRHRGAIGITRQGRDVSTVPTRQQVGAATLVVQLRSVLSHLIKAAR
ncbi:Uncharacterised protein [Bordetella pertussis]|nr:Uncharacterised protein [Bordetella pertussis]